MLEKLIPADHSATVDNVGILGTAKLIFNAGLGYRHTLAFYLKTHQYTSLGNFIYTKTFLPTGEGAGELAYYAIGPVLQHLPQLAPFPRNIEVEMTTRCNKRCIICEHSWWKESSRDITYDEFVSLAEQYPLRWINITGEGDAFLNKDYLRIIAYLKRRHVATYLTDSFDLIDNVTADALILSGVDGIYISMDGATKETYESIKIGCNYDKVISNIKNLLTTKQSLNSPIPEICFRFIITKKNVHEMADFVETIRKLGPKSSWGDGSKIHFAGLLDYPEIHNLYLDEIPNENIAKTVQASKQPDALPVVFAHSEKTTNPSMNRCLAWMEPYFMLVPEPVMIPCCAVMMANSRAKLVEYSFGNYMKEKARDVWNNKYYTWFRRTVTNPYMPVPELCAGCRAYDTTQRIKEHGVDHRKREDFE